MSATPSPRDLEEELAKARASLDEARVKSEGFASLSHEIRTLLNGVIGYTGLLLDTQLASEQRDYVKRIRSSGDALLALLNNVLDFSKIDAQKLELERVDFDPRRAVEEVAELLAERASSKGLELVVDVDDAVPPVLRGDPARLRQVLVNFVSNAIKFTERGEIVVKVRVAGEDARSARVAVEVKDSGVGISAEGQQRLFEPFSQVDGGARQGGTGLGLALSRRLVEAMNGTIGATSELGRGSTFFCEVPLEKRPVAPRRAIPRIDFAGRRALLVAPNAILREVVRRMIEELEIDCVPASSSAQALELVESAPKPFDVAILDKADEGAREVAARLADSSRAPRTRVVLLAYPGQRAAADRESSAAQLAKPVRRGHLHAVLRTLMGQDVEQASMNPASRKKLPQTQSDLVEVRRASRALAAVKDGKRPAQKDAPRALIVEDNVVNQRVAVVLLEKRGFAVDVASNGREAVDRALVTRYALILMDCHMPGMDGYEATGEIRARELAGRRTPIVAMTAHAGDGAREKCLAAGMDDYLSKPVRAEELDRVVKAWARAKDATPAPRRTRRSGEVASATEPRDTEAHQATATPPPRRDARAGARTDPGPDARTDPRPDPRTELRTELRLDARIESRPATSASSDPRADAPASERPALDERALERLRMLDQPDGPDIVAEVVALFQEDATPRVEALRRAAAEGNGRDVVRIAHTLKGSAANVGASVLADLCSSLEERARRDQATDWDTAIRAIEHELERANAALSAFVAGGLA